MNDVQALMYRLLKLFSVKSLKLFFRIEASNQEELLAEIFQQNTEIGLKRFATNNIDLTKQHIYFFRLAHNFNRRIFDVANFPFEIIDEEVNNGVYKFKLLPLIDHNVVIINPFQETNMEFYQPVVLTINGQNLQLQFTILEKNINSYVRPPERVVNVEKVTDEENIKNRIIGFMSDTNLASICDINRGIKYLWANDFVDAKNLKFKKNRSTAAENMDEGYTLKSEYPEVYATLINAPLHKTAFKYLLQDERFCGHFTTDPSAGELSIPIFPNNVDNVNQVQNVISEIIQHN